MATFSQTISVANDCTFYNANQFLQDYFGGGNQGTPSIAGGGARFTNVTIPRGSTISSATFSATLDLVTNAPVLLLYGEAADNAAQMGSRLDMLLRTKTNENMNPGAWTGNVQKNMDVKTIVQAIISRAGWASGNALQLLMVDNGSANSKYVRGSYCSAGSRLSISIDYTVPSGRNNIMIF
jgi:phage gp46-like protein